MSLEFECDPEKAVANAAKHGVRFEEAATAFADPLSITISAPDQFVGESRYILIGRSLVSRLLVVFTLNEASVRASSAPVWRRGASVESMKKPSRTPKAVRTEPASDDMRAEYDFSEGVRGKYAKPYANGSNLVLLDPDVASAFGDSAAVNRALRALLEISPARRPVRARRRPA